MRTYSGCFFSLLFVSFLFSGPATAQTSVGFEDPGDISNLLEYRLPDWSYRTWDANFGFSGNGNDHRLLGEKSTHSEFNGSLNTRYNQNWENDQRLMDFSSFLSSSYSSHHVEHDESEAKQHDLRWQYDFSGSIKQYLYGSPFFAQLSATTSNAYRETVDSGRTDGPWEENNRFDRHYRYGAFTGMGVGHLRNVVPLLRAQRLSERLVSMGRAPLSPPQVNRIAHVLSTDYAYRAVFDRPDRHFWEDVFEPMLDDNNPLTPFEMFYLTEVLSESIGNRMQGFTAGIGFEYREEYDYYLRPDNETSGRSFRQSPSVYLEWYNNLSLNHQIHISGYLQYNTSERGYGENEYAKGSLDLGHLWNVTDRYSLYSNFSYIKDSNINEEIRRETVDLRSSLYVYLEDKIRLETGAGLIYNRYQDDRGESFGWYWSYRLGITYLIDRALF